jgi:hypothetical protein
LSLNTNQDMRGKNWGEVRHQQKLMSVPPDLTGKMVLDIGGYDGAMSLEAINRGAVHATVLDNRQYDQYEDYNNPPIKHDRISFIYQDIMDLEDKGSKMDVIFAFDVMYHMKNPYAFAEQLYALTGKVLCLSTRIAQGGSDYWRLYKPYEQHHNDPTVVWKPTYGSLTKLMEIVGFQKGIMVYTEHPGMYEEDGFVVQRWYK